MPIDLPCPKCGNVATVAEESLGRRGRCRKCGEVFALARPGGGPASAISGDASAWKSGSVATPTNLPEQFGRYRIMKQLGQGGMGAVYLAHDTRLDRKVALKVPFFGPADGPQAIQRFEREARAAATLEHPNLCPIFDVGEVEGIHYLTMPYIEGKPLADAISRGQTLPEAQAAAIVRKLAQALQEAHAHGVVHRDLKPGNIMVNRRKELIIMDFGLARMIGGDDAPLTRTGNVLGTALYMAPEQAAGDLAAIGPASDIYSLGVILYELLTGRRPFEGPWSLVIGLKNVKDPEPPSSHRPDLSPLLDAICLKAISRKPEDRYPTMAEFARDLGGSFLDAPDSTVSPSAIAPLNRSPDTQASQAFEGIIPWKESSLRGESSLAKTGLARWGGLPHRYPIRALIIATPVASLCLALLTYIVVYHKSRIKPLVNTPNSIVIPPKGKASAIANTKATSPVQAKSTTALRLVPPDGQRGSLTQPDAPWSIEENSIFPKVRERTNAILFGKNDWTDYDFSAKARKVGDLSHNGFGLIVRAQDLSKWCGFIHNEGEGGRKTTWITFRGHDGGPSWKSKDIERAKSDIWYDLLIKVRGNHFIAFVNGDTVLEYTDNNFSRGKVGLHSGYYGMNAFRDIKVSAPDGTTLWEGLPDL